MSSFLNQQLTNAGWDALSTALGGGRLTFYKMQAGQGTIANDEAIPGMTSLVTPICDIPISSYVIEGDGQITLFGNINSEDLPTGFTFKELGVFATIEEPVAGKGGTPSGPNIQAIVQAPGTLVAPVVPPPAEGTTLMYSYCNSYDASDYIPGSGESTDVTNTVQVTIKIDQAQDVQINVLAGETFSVVNIGPPSVGAGPWSYTQANVGYFKRLVAGPMTLISEDTDTITVGQKQLTSDLDLYVANGNPDISPNFSSIQNALNYLGQYVIPTSIKARINVSPGTYTSPNTINIDHPNSQSITIQGPQNTTRAGTGLSITGTAYTWNVTVSGISDTSQFVVNDWAMITAINTTNATPALVRGIYKVLSKTASSVTVRIPNPKSSFSVTGGSSISITPISVILTCSTVNAAVVYIGAAGLRLMQYMAVVPTPLPTLAVTPFYIGGTTNLKFIGAAMWNVLLNANGDNRINAFGIQASANCDSCAATYNQSGFVVGAAGSLSMRNCSASFNSFRGLLVESGNVSFIMEASTIGGGGGHGIVLSANGTCGIVATVPPGYVVCTHNDGYGLWCVGGGSIQFSSAACQLYMQNNEQLQPTHYDVVVQNYGLVNSSVCIIGSRIFNSPVGVINSSGGYIG